MADGVGFEPTNPCGLAVFKTAALSRSATHPLTEAISHILPEACSQGKLVSDHQGCIGEQAQRFGPGFFGTIIRADGFACFAGAERLGFIVVLAPL